MTYVAPSVLPGRRRAALFKAPLILHQWRSTSQNLPIQLWVDHQSWNSPSVAVWHSSVSNVRLPPLSTRDSRASGFSSCAARRRPRWTSLRAKRLCLLRRASRGSAGVSHPSAGASLTRSRPCQDRAARRLTTCRLRSSRMRPRRAGRRTSHVCRFSSVSRSVAVARKKQPVLRCHKRRRPALRAQGPRHRWTNTVARSIGTNL